MQGLSFTFGPFVLNTEAGTLFRQEIPVSVGYRGLLLLMAFARRPREVLTKSDLMEAAWPGAVVEEGNLTVQIAHLRKLLGPASDGHEWIATVPRVGYRFIAEVETIDGPHKKPLQLPATPSIAVLPFVNIGNEPEQESFADGLTEDLITDLSRNPGLFVIARNSAFAYKGKAMDVRGIAQELGVRYLLEGSTKREAGRASNG
jgi:DNA-binding winged helix-turn-helix (wHTH) protein